MDAQAVIARLGLKPLPFEGGYYRETYRSSLSFTFDGASRSAGTAIYYLITPDAFSALHRLPIDEVWHFYLGDPVEQIQLWTDGSSRIIRLGHDLSGGCLPQAIVPAAAWQSTRLINGGAFALMGTTLSPGFDPSDYTPGDGAALVKSYPALADWMARGKRGSIRSST